MSEAMDTYACIFSGYMSNRHTQAYTNTDTHTFIVNGCSLPSIRFRISKALHCATRVKITSQTHESRVKRETKRDSRKRRRAGGAGGTCACGPTPLADDLTATEWNPGDTFRSEWICSIKVV